MFLEQEANKLATNTKEQIAQLQYANGKSKDVINFIRKATNGKLDSLINSGNAKNNAIYEAILKYKKDPQYRDTLQRQIFVSNDSNNILFKTLITVDKILDGIWNTVKRAYHSLLPKSVLNFINNIKEKIKKFFINIWNKIVRFFTGEKAPKSSLMFEADEPKSKSLSLSERETIITKIKFLLNLILKCFLYATALTIIGNLIIKVSGNGYSIMKSINNRFNFLNDTPLIEQSNSTGQTILNIITWPFKKMFNGVQALANSSNGIVKIIFYIVSALGLTILTSFITLLYEVYQKKGLKKPGTTSNNTSATTVAQVPKTPVQTGGATRSQ